MTRRTYTEALNRVTKWRSHFAGWQLGTRLKEDAELQAVKDHREATIIHRVELTALTRCLIDRGVIDLEQFQREIVLEAERLEKDYEHRWPGASATDDGMHYDLQKAWQWMSGWKP